MHLMDVCALEVFMCVRSLNSMVLENALVLLSLTVGDFPTVVRHTCYQFKVGESPLLGRGGVGAFDLPF